MAAVVASYAALYLVGALIGVLGSIGRGLGILHRVGALAGGRRRR